VTFRPTESAKHLRQRLKNIGLSDPAIEAAWPAWWSDDAESSSSARTELRFSIARKLGLDPHSLLDEGEPKFVWRGAARFKHLLGESETEQFAITSFGTALASTLITGTEHWIPVAERTPAELRGAILHSQPSVRLLDLLSTAWSVGIPVVHLRVFPRSRKRMSAMAVRVGERYAILLAKDAEYPALVAFYVAHELGHIALGHLRQERAIIDLDFPALAATPTDPEEVAADRFALALLTGTATPTVLPLDGEAGARSLAQAALDASKELQIEPGTLALCFGYSTGKWAIANAAMQYIYAAPKPVWREVNRIALAQLSLERISDDVQAYLLAVLGDLGT
jgi:hypothetical protein